eukprot:scaffold1213_cov350-Prasinococcus_capsulatus_cf.AAC.4
MLCFLQALASPFVKSCAREEQAFRPHSYLTRVLHSRAAPRLDDTGREPYLTLMPEGVLAWLRVALFEEGRRLGQVHFQRAWLPLHQESAQASDRRPLDLNLFRKQAGASARSCKSPHAVAISTLLLRPDSSTSHTSFCLA